jgi:23S rRNA (cytosine1962-C5)-methyltransferase
MKEDHMQIKLKPGKEKSVLNKHPWIFSGAIAKPLDKFYPDVEVVSSSGQFLGRGYFNPASQISCRIVTFSNQKIDRALLKSKLEASIFLRKSILTPLNNAARLVASEADQLPGLIVDQYDKILVVQFLTSGMEYYREIIIDLLKEILNPRTIWDRSDEPVREKEGLLQTSGLIYGDDIAGLTEIIEHGYRLLVDIKSGHKTGFYLDQRTNRLQIGNLASGLRILNCFSYTGGFTVAALLGKAKEVVSVDVSASALEILNQNLAINGSPTGSSIIKADVFEYLRKSKEEGELFDMIILDPPKFINNKADIDRAARGYKDINRLAFQLLKPNGLLATFSCSGHMDDFLFQKIVYSAAVEANCNGQLVNKFMQSSDHPILLTFPESSYLKGLLVRKVHS